MLIGSSLCSSSCGLSAPRSVTMLTSTAPLGPRLSPSPLCCCCSSAAGSALGSSWRQTGQLPCTPSHRSRHSPWKRCPHGISLPAPNASRQIAQSPSEPSPSPSPPAPWTSFSEAIAALDAGGTPPPTSPEKRSPPRMK
uniref:Uncharacterized protein n=1 Tax=Triticum urartu TaxID=4572 RepID=A0A8R7PBF1_TRIUA